MNYSLLVADWRVCFDRVHASCGSIGLGLDFFEFQGTR